MRRSGPVAGAVPGSATRPAWRLQALIAADAAAEAGQFLEATPAGLPVSAALARPGQRLGAWTLLEPIGSGGMARWRAERSDGLYSAQVAIKLLHERAAALDAATAEVQRARFAREGELLARLSRPHIARLLDAGLTPKVRAFWCWSMCPARPSTPGATSTGWTCPRACGSSLQVCGRWPCAQPPRGAPRPQARQHPGDGRRPGKLLDFGVAKLLNDDAGFGDSDLTREGAADLTPPTRRPSS